jgi:hypothetical protein
VFHISDWHIAEGINIGALDGFDVRGPVLRRTLVVHCRDEAHQLQVVEQLATQQM